MCAKYFGGGPIVLAPRMSGISMPGYVQESRKLYMGWSSAEMGAWGGSSSDRGEPFGAHRGVSISAN